MKRKMGIAMVAFGLASMSAASAFAQEEYTGGYMRAPVRAPSQAFELGVSTNYTQGFGRITTGTGNRIQDVANGGINLGLDLGYRATPYFAIGASGNYQEFKADNRLPDNANARGMTAGIQADIHFMPYQRLDPWLQLGTGYRVMWVVPEGAANNVAFHGFELGKAQIGADVRVSNDVAVGPFVGADLNLFVWRKAEGLPNVQLSDKRVGTFIFAGVKGRFDLGGMREAQVMPATARR